MTSSLVGRDVELATLREWVLDPAPDLRAMVVFGEPGIGKTTLLGRLVATTSDDLQVLTAAPAESERTMAWSALGDLFGAHLATSALSGLPPPQRIALEVALLLRSAEDAAGDARTIATATRTALRLLAERGPVLVAIDDAQWLDRETAGALEFALRRSRELPLRYLVSVRAPLSSRDPAPAAATIGAVSTDRVSTIHLTGITIGALGRFLRERLGEPVPRHALIRLHARSAGNPLLALEMARSLRRQGAAMSGLDVPLIEGGLAELVAERVADLPVAARRLLALAASDTELSIAEIRAVVGADTSAAIHSAVEARMLAIDGAVVRVEHPLYAAVAYAAQTVAERRANHRALARLVAEPVRRGRHLAASMPRPSSTTARLLEDAADAASRRGAPAAAADLLAAAGRATPRSRPHEWARRAVGEALLRWWAGDADLASRVVEDALEVLENGRLRTEARLLQAVILEWTSGAHAALAVLRDALREPSLAPDVEAALRLRIATTAPRQTTAARQATLAAARLRADPDRWSDLLACAFLVKAEACLRLGAGVTEDEVDGARRLLQEHGGRPDSVRSFPAAAIARERTWILASLVDDLPLARVLLADAEEDLAGRGFDRSRAIVLADLSVVESWMGQLAPATRHARDAVAVTDETGDTDYARASAHLATAFAATERGDRAAARDAIGAALAARPADVDPHLAARILAVKGRLELLDGRPHDAIVALDRVGELLAQTGDREPGDLRYEGDRLEAAVAVGRLDAAAAILAELERRRARLPRPWLDLVIPRARALCAAADGDVERALAELSNPAPPRHDLLPIEVGRSLLLEGRLRRRLRQKLPAREAFRRAEALFDGAGAAGLAATARAEARRVGVRGARSTELTTTEREVAAAAARGLSTRQVATETFLSPKSVDGVLARVYQKLGIHSRAELGARLGRPLEPPDG